MGTAGELGLCRQAPAQSKQKQMRRGWNGRIPGFERALSAVWLSRLAARGRTCFPSAVRDRGRPGNLSTFACEQFVTNSRLLSHDILGLLFARQNDLQPTLKCA
jgi:hypothetical protein